MSIYETSITNPKKQLEFYKQLSEHLQQENKQLKEKLDCDLQWAFKYEKQIDNWNKLKEYLFDIRKRGFALQNLANVTKNTEPNIAILIIINKLQELEQGSDSNVKD